MATPPHRLGNTTHRHWPMHLAAGLLAGEDPHRPHLSCTFRDSDEDRRLTAAGAR